MRSKSLADGENIMRLRHIAKAIPIIEQSEFVEHDPKAMKGKWGERFGNRNPIHIEIGMGKGKFITTLAALNPDINYIGIERADSVLYRALQKQQELKLPNLILLMINADELEEYFDENEIDRIYLNFSDPWPKAHHARRRLTSGTHMDKYAVVLKPEGCVCFKTDNRSLFDYSLEAVAEAGWSAEDVTYDLHNSPYAEGNVMTEYEERFSSMGNPINRAVFKYVGSRE